MTKCHCSRARTFTTAGVAAISSIPSIPSTCNSRRFISQAKKSARSCESSSPGMCAKAIALYGVRLLDNIDLDRVAGIERRGPVIASALMERGDARAFAMGRRILDALEE